MADIAAASPSTVTLQSPAEGRPKLDHPLNPLVGIMFLGILAAAVFYVAYSLYADVSATETRVTTYAPYLLLFVALLIALGFEFVNGFHDTANAVATVIYTRALPANFAVVWSGTFNLLGVLLSSGAVAQSRGTPRHMPQPPASHTAFREHVDGAWYDLPFARYPYAMPAVTPPGAIN